MTTIERLQKLANSLNLDQQRAQLKELEEQIAQPTFWDDPETAGQISQRAAALKSLITQFDSMLDLAGEGSEEEVISIIGDDLEILEKRALLGGKYDAEGAIVTINAGAGGTDAQDWAQMLLRLYQRWQERAKTQPLIIDRSNWQTELVDVSRGEEAGLKSATFIMKGSYAYGLMKTEAGVHRLVRQSPFNAKGLRQTSFAQVDVIPSLDKPDVAVDEKDLRIDVYRSSGPGGQSVNTTDSAVRIMHIPTGLTAAVQDEKSQLKNKQKALSILYSRIAARHEEEQRAKIAAERGETMKNEWGSQIRSYVLHPYKQVKDHRTGIIETNVEDVLDGGIDSFVLARLEQTEK